MLDVLRRPADTDRRHLHRRHRGHVSDYIAPVRHERCLAARDRPGSLARLGQLSPALFARRLVLWTNHALHNGAIVKQRLAHALGFVLRRIAEAVRSLLLYRLDAVGTMMAALSQPGQ